MMKSSKASLFPNSVELSPRPLYDFLTDLYQRLVSLIGLLLLSPLLLLIGICVKWTSKGPIFYRGKRVGKDEKIFFIYKFRTMKVGSEQKIGKRLVRQDENHYTSIGPLLRKYRLDELPQLINVVLGHMALVGPRPMRPIFLEDLKKRIQGYEKRFLIKPGITGLAQVRGGYYTDPRHKLFYEMIYAQHRSFFFDIQLILQTFLRVMTKILSLSFALTWLFLAAFVLPQNVQSYFYIQSKFLHLNVLYILLPLYLVLRLFIKGMNRQRIYILRTPVDFYVFLFLLWCGVGIYFSHYPLQSFRGTLWYICNVFLPFYLCMNSIHFRQNPLFWIQKMVYFGGVICGFALLKAIYEGVIYNHWTRIGGSLEDPVWFSILCVCLLPLGWTLLGFQTLKRLKSSWMYIGSLVIMSGAFLGAGSRLGFLALGGIFLMRSTPQIKRWSMGVLFGTVCLFSLSGDLRFSPSVSYQAAQKHLTHQSDLLGYLSIERMIVGVGARTVPTHLAYAQKHRLGRYQRTPQLRNTWLTLWVEHGLIGFTLLLMILLKSVMFLYQRSACFKESHPEVWEAVQTFLLSLYMLMWIGLFCDIFLPFPLTLFFWSTLGCAVGVCLEHQSGIKKVYRIVHAHAPL